MKTTASLQSICSRLRLFAIPAGVAAAISVSNGLAVGIAVGAVITIVMMAARR